MIPRILILFKKSPLPAFIKFEPTFLTGSLAVCLSAPVQGGAGPAQIPTGLCGVNSRGLSSGGIFTPHFERGEIVAGPPAEPSQFRSDIFKQTPPVRK